MRRFIIAALLLLLIPACAIAYPGATFTVAKNAVTVGNLDCGTQYEFRVREWRNGAWRDSNTYTRTTLACPTPTPTPSPSPTPTPTATPSPTATPTPTTTPSPTPSPTVTPTPTPPPSGTNNCLPDPSACGFPDEDNTGPTTVMQDVRLAKLPSGAAWDGDTLRITANNVTVDGVDIPGSVTVDGNNFTLSNSRINIDSGCSNYPCGNFGIRLGQSGGAIQGTKLLNDDIVIPANFNLHNANGAVKVEFGVRNNGDNSVVMDRSMVKGFSDAWHGQGTITNSYLTGQEVLPGDHIEAFINGGEGNPTILNHNTILTPPSDDGTNGSADLAFYNDFGGIKRVDVVNNLLGGGGFVMYGGAKNGTGNVTGPVTVRDNRITRAYFPNGGFFGLWSEFNAAVTTGCNNVWDDTGSPAPNPPGGTC